MIVHTKPKYIISICIIILLLCCCFAGCVSTDNASRNDRVDFGNSSVLVVYFSASGNTETIAGYIKSYLNTDLQEIVPTNRYTSADLNWNNSNSRVNAEHNASVNNDSLSPYFRPEFVKSFDTISSYDIIFLGYPIWWGEAPNIIYSFLEEYGGELSQKTIIPFCTSSSSGVGQSAEHLHSLVPSATWFTGKRFSGSASIDSVNEWLESLKK